MLTLVLTLAMMLSIMVVGTGAAFTDDDAIVNKEAVDACVTLNIIGGYDDGSFLPNGNITRAEMCKMITVALNGGKEPSMGSNLGSSFADVANDHWAVPYIEYCSSEKIVSGVGDNNFAPNGNITGSQAAKMLLCILGYNAEIQGYVNNSFWETKINVDAAQKGLYAELGNVDASVPLTRDQAAQMIWNALNAYEVEYVTTLVAGPNGQLTSQVTVRDKVVGENSDKITLLADKYEAKTFIGTFNGDSNVYPTTLKDGQIQVTGDVNSNGKDSGPYTAKFPFALDIKYIGEEVKVLYKDKINEGTNGQPDDKDVIYGVYVTGNSTVINATRNDIDKDYTTANKVTINDKVYDLAASGTITENLITANDISWTTDGNAKINALGQVNGDAVKFILDDENKIDHVYVTTTTLNKVTAVSGTKISLTDVGTIDTAENGTQVYSGIATDDIVTVTKLYNDDVDDATFVIEKAQTVTGDVTAYSGHKTITMNGTVYKVYNETLMSNIVDDNKDEMDENCLDSEFTLYLVNGYVRAAQESADNLNQYAIVLAVNEGKLDSTFEEPRAELMLTDGTKVNALIHKDSKIYTTNDCDHASSPDNTYTDGAIVAKGAKINTGLEVNQIVKYSVMSNGQYKIEECGNYGRAADDAVLYNKDTTAFGTSPVVTDGSCILFYTNGSDMKVANIRNLGTIEAQAADTLFASVTNSSGKVVAAFIDYNGKPSGASTDTMYGIITSEGDKTNKDGDPYTMYTVWTGENTTIYVSGTGANTLEKGMLVSFDKSADDTYSQTAKYDGDISILDATHGADSNVGDGDGKAVAVTEYNKTDNTLTYATTLKKEGNAFVADGKTPVSVDKDVKIVYVDAKDKKAGTSSGTVNTFDGTTGYANALLVFDEDNSSKKVVAIIVNTNPKANVLGAETPAATAVSVTAPTAGTGYTVSVVDNKTSAYKGEEITLLFTTTAAASVSNYEITVSPTNAEAKTGNTGKATFATDAAADSTVRLTYIVDGTGTVSFALSGQIGD